MYRAEKEKRKKEKKIWVVKKDLASDISAPKTYSTASSEMSLRNDFFFLLA